MRLAALAAFAFFVAAPAFAEEALPKDATLLHLTQEARRDVTRDRLTVTMRTEATAPDPRTAQETVNRRMAAALDLAKSVASVKAHTGYYYTNRISQAGAAPEYNASQTIELTGEKFDELLVLAGKLEAQQLLMAGMHFSVRPETLRALQDELSAEALKLLGERARNVASVLNMHVVRYCDLTVGNAQEPGSFQPVAAGAGMALRAAAPVAEAGEASVGVTVQADVVLLPGS